VAPVVDAQVVTKQGTSGSTIVSPPLTTSTTNELLVAFLVSDATAAGQRFNSITGGGLTWRLRRRQNTQLGTAEIWVATATAKLTSVTFTATRNSGSFDGMMVVTAFKGADTAVDGAVNGASASSGAPIVSLTTLRASSVVWGVGVDIDAAVARTVGSTQTKVEEFLDSGNSYWVQRLTSPVGAAGTAVTVNCTAPTADRYNLAAIEILAGP